MKHSFKTSAGTNPVTITIPRGWRVVKRGKIRSTDRVMDDWLHHVSGDVRWLDGVVRHYISAVGLKMQTAEGRPVKDYGCVIRRK